MTNLNNFLLELKDLLTKHDVMLYWSCSESSDTFGINDSHLAIQKNNDYKNAIKFDNYWIDGKYLSKFINNTGDKQQ